MRTKISVIIPIYNTEKYLDKCLDSIINQTLKDIEIICINDGSTDNSGTIIQKYAQTDTRIQIINQKNQGVANTRNNGIKKASGEYLFFIDSDDFIDYDFLEKLYITAKRKNSDFVRGNYKKISEFGTLVDNSDNEIIRKSLLNDPIPNTSFTTAWWATIFKKEIVDKYNINFPNCNFLEDMAFLYKFQAVATSFELVDNTFYYYVFNNNSLTNKISSNLKNNFLDAIKSRIDVLSFIDKTISNNEKYLKHFELNFNRLKFTLENNHYEKEIFFQISEELSNFRYAKNFPNHTKDEFWELSTHKDFEKIIYHMNFTKYYDKEASIQILKQLDTTENKPVVFWGASLFLKEFLKQHSIKNYNIIGIIDNNKDLWEKDFENVKVYSPEKLINIKPKFIIFTIKNNSTTIYNNVIEEIHNLKLYETAIFPNIFRNTIKKTHSNNHIYLVRENGQKEEVSFIKGLSINFEGDNNIIEIGTNPIPNFKDSKITCGNECVIKIGSSKYNIRNLDAVVTASNSKLTIGNDLSFEGGYIALRDEPNLEINIGNDCMFSANIYIRSSDAHSIYKKESKELLNKPENLYIGNHVWLCNGVTILKNTRISDNSIVGIKSIVTKTFSEPNIIIAGNPAKKVKENINWDRKNTYLFEKELQNA